MEKEPVKIVYNTLKEQIEEGWKIDELKAHYGLNHSQMKNVLKQTNLTIRKFRKNPPFIIEGFTPEPKEEICTEGENTLQVELTELANKVEDTTIVKDDISSIESTLIEENSEAMSSEEIQQKKNFWEN